MRFLNLILLLALINLPAQAQSTVSKGASAKARAASQKKLEREILKAENLLGKAIARCDAAALNKLLTDYYADAFEGSERATTKKATIARCKNGTLHFYNVNENRTISISVDIVTVEGNADAAPTQKETQEKKETDVHVKRLWTKKDGRWQLVGQTIGPADEESER
ncbi:MAG TPA: nuclear transport factor 2 family protein [Pyrinomonadaceae bacterium]|nr:nuclear transport factor 2 family protein [Pyrinomonadaceae bacterium]